jgi:Glycosyltransferase family 87
MLRETFVRSAAVRAAALGCAAFLVACALPGIGLYTGEQVGDVKLFQTFGDRTLAGEIPYRDIFVEYPPGALPVFVAPSLAPADDYVPAFKGLQIVLGLATIALATLTLALLRTRPRRLYLAALYLGLAPLALGPTMLNRYDLWPAALLAAALAGLVGGRVTLAFALLGLAVVAKGYAVVAIPPALLYVWARSGRAALRRALVAGSAAALLVVAPFLALGPGGVRESLRVQLDRGLHLESLGGSLLAAADRAGAYEARVVPGFAFELDGRLPGAVAKATNLLQLAALVGIWLLVSRGPATPHRLLVAVTASVAAFAAFGKVLSPQFLIWLLPLVAVSGGLAAPALLLGALAATHAYFPGRYGDVVALGGSTWLVLARNLLLVALVAVLALRLHASARVERDSADLEPAVAPPLEPRPRA